MSIDNVKNMEVIDAAVESVKKADMSGVKPSLVSALMERAEISHERVVATARWEEMNKLSDTILNGMVEMAQGVSVSANRLVGHDFPSAPETNQIVKSFSIDIQKFVGDVMTVRETHKDRKGQVKNGHDRDNFAETFDIYHDLSTKFQNYILPVNLQITQALTEVAEQLAVQQKAEEQAEANLEENIASPAEENKED